MGWLIELAKEAIPEPMPEPGAKPETSPSPAYLTTLLAEACQGVEGIDAATFRILLSPEDVENIEGGHIPVHTLNAYAKSFAEGIRTGRIRVLLPLIQEPRCPCACAVPTAGTSSGTPSATAPG